ncbi:MAG TPA: TerB family tellurite resistance protein, partial [Ignavibacteriaceae bacterium]|nr:TerB family tellurite resistance protein [Ignavibacteriaceae bacterium]
LKKIFNSPEAPEQIKYEESPVSRNEQDKKLKVATCTLFIEMAKADDNFTEVERDKIISIMKSTFDLEDECINDLMELAEKRLEDDDSIYDFTKLINQNFSNDQKFELLKNFWRLIYVDKKLDMYEDHLIKKIGGLINMGHEDIIGAKMLIKGETGS